MSWDLIKNIAALSTFLGIIYWVVQLVLFISEPDFSYQKIICDRDIDNGCYIDLSEEYVKLSKMNVYDQETVSIFVKNADYKMIYLLPNLKEFNIDTLGSSLAFSPFPQYQFQSLGILGEYKMKVVNRLLTFSGKIIDIENGEILGWLSNNEFEIVKPCALSWNKDDRGLEIIDRKGHVCFSIDSEVIEPRGVETKTYLALTFRGYFKANNSYYIFTDEKVYCEKNVDDALSRIKLIKPRFEHFAKKSNGVRVN